MPRRNTYWESEKPIKVSAAITADAQVVPAGTSGYVIGFTASSVDVAGGGIVLYDGESAAGTLLAASGRSFNAIPIELMFPQDARPRFDDGLFVARDGASIVGARVYYWLED